VTIASDNSADDYLSDSDYEQEFQFREKIILSRSAAQDLQTTLAKEFVACKS